jgi:hypothetical protein
MKPAFDQHHLEFLRLLAQIGTVVGLALGAVQAWRNRRSPIERQIDALARRSR